MPEGFATHVSVGRELCDRLVEQIVYHNFPEVKNDYYFVSVGTVTQRG